MVLGENKMKIDGGMGHHSERSVSRSWAMGGGMFFADLGVSVQSHVCVIS
jgi:hypothetical protein